MKKIFKALSLVLILMMMITLTSCKKENSKIKPADHQITADNFIYYDESHSKDDYVFIGYFDGDDKIYLEATADFKYSASYQPIYSKISKDGSVNVPNIVVKGKIFKGLFTEKMEKQDDGTEKMVIDDKGNPVLTRVTEITDEITKKGVLTVEFITYGNAGLIALVCIVIVFLMLALIWGIVSLFRFFPQKKVKTDDKTNKSQVIETKKVFTMADIKDDDMMAAALVATIDYHNETGENVRVVSVKQIG